jgi:glutathione S-transferase
MTPRYYFTPGTCSLAGMIALEVAEVAYEPCQFDFRRRETLPTISPTGKVPALVTESGTINETLAISCYVHHLRPEAGILPHTSEDFAHSLSMMSWLSSELHILRRQFARPQAFVADPAAQDMLRKEAAGRYRKGLDRLDGFIREGRFDAQRYGVGAAGYALLFVDWARMDGMHLPEHTALDALARTMLLNGSVRRALERHVSHLLAM